MSNRQACRTSKRARRLRRLVKALPTMSPCGVHVYTRLVENDTVINVGVAKNGSRYGMCVHLPAPGRQWHEQVLAKVNAAIEHMCSLHAPGEGVP